MTVLTVSCLVLDYTNQDEQDRLPSMLQPEKQEPFPELYQNTFSKPKEELMSKDYVSGVFQQNHLSEISMGTQKKQRKHKYLFSLHGT